MERFNHNEQAVDILLTPEDVEIAVREFLHKKYPELQENWLLSPKYNIGSVIITGTKQ
jgi:hypothetical protein